MPPIEGVRRGGFVGIMPPCGSLVKGLRTFRLTRRDGFDGVVSLPRRPQCSRNAQRRLPDHPLPVEPARPGDGAERGPGQVSGRRLSGAYSGAGLTAWPAARAPPPS